MGNEKMLILESEWSVKIEDGISTSRIYRSIDALSSFLNTPIQIIYKPLLCHEYLDYIEQFVRLKDNRRGANIIIISAHGYMEYPKHKGKKKYRRVVEAWDGDINLSEEMRQLDPLLKRSIIILDSCEIGEKISSFRKAINALGVIGFSSTLDWVDSSVFIFALLCKYSENNVLSQGRVSAVMPRKVLENMEKNHYKSLFKSLKVEFDFRESKEK
jgi:hypothetical protein